MTSACPAEIPYWKFVRTLKGGAQLWTTQFVYQQVKKGE